jgi:phosphomevalonate kinase
MKTRPTHVVNILSPGKLFLLGEYAVLEGHPAAVMAVDRYVRLSPCAGSAPDGGDPVSLARKLAECALGMEPGPETYRADSTSLFHGGKKLGLGSSAAVVAASAASVFHQAGRDITKSSTRREIWGIAKKAHDSFQRASGSGADIAASLAGGVIVFRRHGESGADFMPAKLPAGIHLVFIWTAETISTASTLRSVECFRKKDPAGYRDIIDGMGAAAGLFISAGLGTPSGFIASFHEYGSMMSELGRRCGSPAAAPAVEMAARHAAELGGAAKPSGAAGGDFIVAAFGDPRCTERFSRRMADAGLETMDFSPARLGVHAETGCAVSRPEGKEEFDER